MSVRADAGARGSRWIPWAFVGFFLAVAAVQGVMIWLAVASFSGLATDSPYERGLDYNETLAAKAAETALGWQAEARFVEGAAAAGAGRAGRLELELLDRAGEPIAGAKVAARLRRPVGPEATVEFALGPDGPGRYAAAAELPLAGQWDVDLDVASPAGEAHFTQRIFVP
jgi:nitrogen fixation protein FixH